MTIFPLLKKMSLPPRRQITAHFHATIHRLGIKARQRFAPTLANDLFASFQHTDSKSRLIFPSSAVPTRRTVSALCEEARCLPSNSPDLAVKFRSEVDGLEDGIWTGHAKLARATR